MDQSGGVLPINGKAENKVFEGVTTAIAGEGGSEVGSAQLDKWFTDLQKKGIAINFGTYYGAGQARVEVMGDKDGRPTEAQEAAMREHVAQAMRAGAQGIATALIYPPYSFQNTDELVDLSKVAARYTVGPTPNHMRDESGDLLKAIHESIEIGERSGIQVEIFHFKAAYAPEWGKLMPQAVALVDEARARREHRGGHVRLHRRRHRAFDHRTQLGVRRWRGQGLRAAARSRHPRQAEEGSRRGLGARLVEPRIRFGRLGPRGVLANAHNPKWDKYRYKSIAYIATQVHEDPEDVAWDITLDALPHRAMGLYFMIDERRYRNRAEAALGLHRLER